ncbi:MAG: 3-hydroxyacyl-CoA dehydrogenase NAD-binding domain-containing protein [Candidatus Thorarchaeota archaeon]
MTDISHINNIAIIGAGVQGHSIAQIALMAGFDKVIINDLSIDIIERAVSLIRNQPEWGLKKLESESFLQEGDTTETILKRLIKEPDLKKAVENADFIIEAVPEVMDIKLDVYKKLGEYTPDNTVIATNTSTMSPSKMGEAAGKPENVIGMHFFNPIKTRLIEITKGEKTSNESMEIGIAVGNKLPATDGKRVVIQLEKETPGHIANRVVASTYVYLNWILEQAQKKNISFEQLDADVADFLPNGVCLLCDAIGLDTVYNVLNYFSEVLSPEFTPGKVLTSYIEKGDLGRKTGKGFYNWPNGVRPELNLTKKAEIVEVDVLIGQQLNEGCRLLEQGIVKGYRVIDKAVSIGYSIPGPFSLGKRNYKQLSNKLEEASQHTGLTYLKPCSLMKSGEFLKMRK